MLGKHILATIVYYDCLEYPLSAFEIWKHLLDLDEALPSALPPTLGLVMQALRELSAQGKIAVRRGLYTLPRREGLIDERIRDEKISIQKLKRARSLVMLLQWVPFVRMIAIAGSLAMKKSEPKSDWDFFVVLRSGRIWIGRTFLSGVLQLLGKRRHGRYIENRACLNYYLTEEALEISPKDLFAAHEYRFLLPLFDRGVFTHFELANRWIARFKPNFSPTEISNCWMITLLPSLEKLQSTLEWIFDRERLEKWLSDWQKKKIARNPKTHQSGSFIETSERALIFLPEPKGPKLFDRFKVRLGETLTDSSVL